MRYHEQPDGSLAPNPGYEALWNYFGLTYASFLTLPRACMHEMPDDWQGRMAALLHEWDEAWSNAPEDVSVGFQVRACRGGGRLVNMPDVLVNYRHPESDRIRSWMTPLSATHPLDNP